MQTDQRVIAVLATIVVCLVMAHLLAHAAWSRELPFSGTAMLLFDLDNEANLPTWCSSALLAWNALLAWQLLRFVPRHRRLARAGVVALGGVFLFLSADEAAKLHERLAGSLATNEHGFGAGWIVYWLPLAFIAAAGLTIALWRFSRSFVFRLAVGAAFFLTGAVIVEVFNQSARSETIREMEAGLRPDITRNYDRSDNRRGKDTFAYTLGTSLEEGLEFTGIVIWSAVIRGARREAERTRAKPTISPAPGQFVEGRAQPSPVTARSADDSAAEGEDIVQSRETPGTVPAKGASAHESP